MSAAPPSPHASGGEDRFDVVVIGAGIAGLVAAARMQKRGARVLLLEQHEIVGGYCTNFKRGAYEFDSSIHCVAGCEPGGDLYRTLSECGAAGYVDFIPLRPYLYKAVHPGRVLRIPSDLEALVDLLAAEFPRERGVRTYFAELGRIYDTVTRLGARDGSALGKLLLPITSPRGVWALARALDAPCASLLARHLDSHELRQIVSQMWGFFGLPPSRLSLPVFVMGSLGYYRQGAYYVRGGSQQLSNALARAFVDGGGVLRVEADAELIVVQDGRVREVGVRDRRTGERTRYRAPVVLSCADVSHTLCDLVGAEHLPRTLVARLGQLVPAASAFVVYLGVDMRLPSEHAHDFDVLVSLSGDADRGYRRMLAGEGFDDFALTIYSNLEPALSPAPGRKHVITLLAMMNLGEPTMAARWGTSDIHERGPEYVAIKEALAERLLESAERLVPGLGAHAEVVSIATPVTMKRYTRNLNGSIMGWENSPGQSMLRRMQHRTPIDGLFLSSAWTFPGGGVNGVALGASAASELVLARLTRGHRRAAHAHANDISRTGH
jgi:prolycopene isomerase